MHFKSQLYVIPLNHIHKNKLKNLRNRINFLKACLWTINLESKTQKFLPTFCLHIVSSFCHLCMLFIFSCWNKFLLVAKPVSSCCNTSFFSWQNKFLLVVKQVYLLVIQVSSCCNTQVSSCCNPSFFLL